MSKGKMSEGKQVKTHYLLHELSKYLPVQDLVHFILDILQKDKYALVLDELYRKYEFGKGLKLDWALFDNKICIKQLSILESATIPE